MPKSRKERKPAIGPKILHCCKCPRELSAKTKGLKWHVCECGAIIRFYGTFEVFGLLTLREFLKLPEKDQKAIRAKVIENLK